MKRPTHWIAPFLLLSACAAVAPAEERKISSSEPVSWQNNGGIETATVDESLLVVRADPRITPLALVNPPETKSASMAEVAVRDGFAVMINAAMFAKDYATSIGYMRNYGNVNNPRVSAKLRGFLMFNPKSPRAPAVRIAGKKESDGYHTTFQSHRMWDSKEGILWKKGSSIYHQVGLVGVDGKNRVLFFYHPGLIDVHELVAKILGLGLDLTGLLYLDGGFHGSFYLAPELGRASNASLTLPNLLGLRYAKP